ncbi:uncharacterized protein LOC114254868 [Monomorium pharaonis]|uniref:uncharacterized protein LOC114254868 n=1 Tax=Monomorium pharaonis TaxID=307658 RepID=UPI00102E1BC3|nr:uncharacterized protein LOC114254868 [Monomorium pharaonis]
MVDFITICNSACITCIWCILFSVCFPRCSKNLRKQDSSECCVRKKPILRKHRRAYLHDFSNCVRTGSIHARRRFKDSPCYERNHENQERRLCHRKKMCVQSGERQNIRQCKNREASQICCEQIKHLHSHNKSNDSLNKKNGTNIDLKIDKSKYCVCKRS